MPANFKEMPPGGIFGLQLPECGNSQVGLNDKTQVTGAVHGSLGSSQSLNHSVLGFGLYGHWSRGRDSISYISSVTKCCEPKLG